LSDRAARPTRPESFLVYRNVDLGLVMKYPAAWQTNEQASPIGFMLALLSPPESPASQFRENVVFAIQPLMAPIKLDEYVAFALRQIQGAYQIGAPAAATLASLPARQVTYTGPLDPMLPLAGRYLAVCAIKDVKAYFFRYTARAEKFDEFLAIVQEMLESVDIV